MDEIESSSVGLARTWREMYNALLQEGFNEREALELLKTWITAMWGGIGSGMVKR